MEQKLESINGWQQILVLNSRKQAFYWVQVFSNKDKWISDSYISDMIISKYDGVYVIWRKKR